MLTPCFVRGSLAAAIATVALACGSSSETSGGAGTGASTSAASGSGGQVGGAGGGGGGGATASSAGGGNGTAGGGGDANGSGGAGGSGGGPGTGGGSAGLVPELVQNNLSVNCQPIVGKDPVNGSFTATYDNTKGAMPASAAIVDAEVKFEKGGNTLKWSFDATPTTSGSVPAGIKAPVLHTKVQGSGSGNLPTSPCAFCGGTMTLAVDWDVAGSTVKDALGPAPFACLQ
jgi:hypothetical protein